MKGSAKYAYLCYFFKRSSHQWQDLLEVEESLGLEELILLLHVQSCCLSLIPALEWLVKIKHQSTHYYPWNCQRITAMTEKWQIFVDQESTCTYYLYLDICTVFCFCSITPELLHLSKQNITLITYIVNSNSSVDALQVGCYAESRNYIDHIIKKKNKDKNVKNLTT